MVSFDLAFGKALDADLRAGQVGQDADLGTDTYRSGADFGRTLGLAGRIAVAEIEAHHVDARLEQSVQHTGRIRGRSERCEDLGAALTFFHDGLL